MELFEEVKNRYFHIILKVLNESKNGFSKDDIIKIVDAEEFQEKVIGKGQQTFDKLLLNEYDDNENYNLLKEIDEKFFPVFNNELSVVPIRFTNIEKSWLKSLIEQPNIELLLSDKTIEKLKSALKDIHTPIKNDLIEITNISNLPKILEIKEYEKNFKIILQAIMGEKPIRYCNKDKFGNQYCDRISIPIRLEYSLKDGRFRVSMYSLNDNRHVMANIHTMSSVEIDYEVKSEIDRQTALKLLYENKYSPEPILLEVIDEKAAMERCFMSFSSLERTARCIDEAKYEIKLYYYMFEEEEIIRKILALGPYVKVISPERIVNEVIKRIRKAMETALFE